MLAAIFAVVLMGVGNELLAAEFTSSQNPAIRESQFIEEQGMLSPKEIIICAVACMAKGDKIIEGIGFFAISEKAKRNLMMNCELVGTMTVGALIVISLKNFCLLLIPVRSSITSMTTTPCGVISACKKSLRSTHILIIA